jgi:sulfide:quinone oxidoreductase
MHTGGFGASAGWLGELMSPTNAKTVAAAHKQAPVVAENLLTDRAGKVNGRRAICDGSCPPTVANRKFVFAEFG